MKTKAERLEEILSELEGGCDHDLGKMKIIAIFKECVPDEIHTPHYPHDEYDGGFNDCILKTLKNIEEMGK